MSKRDDNDEFDSEALVDEEVFDDTVRDDQTDDQVVQLLQQVAALTEALQRERADVSNLRRRHDEQISGLKTTVTASVIRELLPVIDNFERALKHVPKELEGSDFVAGVKALVKQFDKTLATLGVQKIKTVGEVFNPHLHEAVSMEEGDGKKEIVSEELQAGYRLGNGNNAEVLRHAMVRVKNA